MSHVKYPILAQRGLGPNWALPCSDHEHTYGLHRVSFILLNMGLAKRVLKISSKQEIESFRDGTWINSIVIISNIVIIIWVLPTLMTKILYLIIEHETRLLKVLLTILIHFKDMTNALRCDYVQCKFEISTLNLIWLQHGTKIIDATEQFGAKAPLYKGPCPGLGIVFINTHK